MNRQTKRVVTRVAAIAASFLIGGWLLNGGVGTIANKLSVTEVIDRIEALNDPGDAEATPVRTATVIRAVDGDTLKVRFPNGSEPYVRLIGYDTPESTLETECGGPQASTFTKKLTNGKAVKLTVDPTQDKVDRYGRLLRYAQVNGKDVGQRVVAAGWGAPYVYDSSRPPQKTGIYRKAASNAKTANRGVWALCGGNFHSNDDQPWSGD